MSHTAEPSTASLRWATREAPVATVYERAALAAMIGAEPTGRGVALSAGELADTIRCSTRTVTRTLAALEAAGLIRPGERAGTWDVVWPGLDGKAAE